MTTNTTANTNATTYVVAYNLTANGYVYEFTKNVDFNEWVDFYNRFIYNKTEDADEALEFINADWMRPFNNELVNDVFEAQLKKEISDNELKLSCCTLF